jgi:hypothetical protein
LPVRVAPVRAERQPAALWARLSAEPLAWISKPATSIAAAAISRARQGRIVWQGCAPVRLARPCAMANASTWQRIPATAAHAAKSARLPRDAWPGRAPAPPAMPFATVFAPTRTRIPATVVVAVPLAERTKSARLERAPRPAGPGSRGADKRVWTSAATCRTAGSVTWRAPQGRSVRVGSAAALRVSWNAVDSASIPRATPPTAERATTRAARDKSARAEPAFARQGRRCAAPRAWTCRWTRPTVADAPSNARWARTVWMGRAPAAAQEAHLVRAGPGREAPARVGPA